MRAKFMRKAIDTLKFTIIYAHLDQRVSTVMLSIILLDDHPRAGMSNAMCEMTKILL